MKESMDEIQQKIQKNLESMSRQELIDHLSNSRVKRRILDKANVLITSGCSDEAKVFGIPLGEIKKIVNFQNEIEKNLKELYGKYGIDTSNMKSIKFTKNGITTDKLFRNTSNKRGKYSIQCKLIRNRTNEVVDWFEDYEDKKEDAKNYFKYLEDAHKSFDYDVDYTRGNK